MLKLDKWELRGLLKVMEETPWNVTSGTVTWNDRTYQMKTDPVSEQRVLIWKEPRRA